MKPVSRRGFLEASLFAGASSVIASRLAFANAPTDSRFVFVLLRGALDGLSAVPPSAIRTTRGFADRSR